MAKRWAIVNQRHEFVKRGYTNRARAEIELEDYGPGHRLIRDRAAEAGDG